MRDVVSFPIHMQVVNESSVCSAVIFGGGVLIDSIAQGTGLETAIFHTPMRVAPNVISQHFRTNLLHVLFVPKKT